MRRLFGGHDAGRANEDYAEPDQQGQPVFEKLSHSLVGRSPRRTPNLNKWHFTETLYKICQSEIRNPQFGITAPLAFEPIFFDQCGADEKMFDVRGLMFDVEDSAPA